MIRYCTLPVLFWLLLTGAYAQHGVIKGVVTDARTQKPVKAAEVFIQGSVHMAMTNDRGAYVIENVNPGTYQLAVFYPGVPAQVTEVRVTAGENRVDFQLDDATALREVVVEDQQVDNYGIKRLMGVEGSAIYEAKKTEVIVLKDIDANLATNNARQIFAKVPGLNIWESDGAGLQLGIGARGLDPNRTANFNVRQNGYDISADALGYPESYYTPPAEAIDRIEVVRGAASLQYGTQFGGLLNFVLHDGPESKPVELVSRQSVGSFGLFNTFNSLGGTRNKIRYYTYFQHKQGDGWRPNAAFDVNTAYGTVTYTPTDKLSITGQYTYMRYLAQQPGGLTDTHFEEDPRQSIRSRNWFRVDWNLVAVLADYRFSNRWKLNARIFGLAGGRDALGNLGRIDRADDGAERDLFVDDFNNIGAELRVVHHYNALAHPSVLVAGARYYRGFTHRRQGLGPDGSDDDFRFLNPGRLEGSDYDFAGNNAAVFAENIFNLSDKVSVTPGIRFEHILTAADGYYQNSVLRPNPDTGIAEDSVFRVDEEKDRTRSFIIAGVGLSYKPAGHIEFYGNFSQNYRAINFNDIRVENPNITVDPEIHDEKGFNADLGVRGGKDGVYNFDVSLFYLRYNGRIGSVLRGFERYRTNVGSSQHIGLEAFGQVELLSFFKEEHTHRVSVFGNVSITEATYVSSKESAVRGNDVELVPSFNLKGGITWQWKNLQATGQGSFTAEQFSDATNATFTPSAVEGIIPSYYVVDLSARYTWRFLILEGGINNLTDNMYFTRRAAGYPGPGIIPADGRNFYVTVGVRL